MHRLSLARAALSIIAAILLPICTACADRPAADPPRGENGAASVAEARRIIPAFDPRLDLVRAPAGFGTGRVWHVGPSRQFKKPSDVVKRVGDGDVVAIDAATYKCDQSVRWTANNLTFIGVGGRPVLDATGCTIKGDKGIWNPSGANMIVDNIAFLGASGPSRNDAGIRYDGTGYVYITRCYFQNNQDGILFTPPKGHTTDLVIDHSEFFRNGAGDGQSHNMYIGNWTHSFVLRFSYSHEAKIGHEVKTRAQNNAILYNRLADEEIGTASYEIDIPQGGLSFVVGNLIEKAPSGENPIMIAYAGELNAPENPVQRLYLFSNTIVDRQRRIGDRRLLLTQRPEARVVFGNNLIMGLNPDKLPAKTAPQIVIVDETVSTERPGFADAAHGNYALGPHSPAIGAGVTPPDADGFGLMPVFEFVPPASAQPRPDMPKLDAGAYAYVAGEERTPAPSISLAAAQNPVPNGGTAHLDWSAAGASGCVADGDWAGAMPPAGSFTSGQLFAPARFRLACIGRGGTAEAELAVAVAASAQAAALGDYSWQRVADSALKQVCPDRAQSEAWKLGIANGCIYKADGAAGVYVPETQHWYLIGGNGSADYFGNEVYAFNAATMRPERVTEPTPINRTREFVDGRFQFRGCDGALHLDDGAIAPANRRDQGQVAYDPLLRQIIVGPGGFVRGGGCAGATLNQWVTDMWSFDPVGRAWKQIAGADDRFGGTGWNTWFLDPATGSGYSGGGSRNKAPRGGYLVDVAAHPPSAVLVDNVYPFGPSAGPTAIDTRHHFALHLVPARPGDQPGVTAFDLNGLSMHRYGTDGRPGTTGEIGGPGLLFRPEPGWTIRGATSFLSVAWPSLTYNPKLDMFVAWAGGPELFFLKPDYNARRLDVTVKMVPGGPTVDPKHELDGFLTYMPDRDAYLAFSGFDRDFWILKPPE